MKRPQALQRSSMRFAAVAAVSALALVAGLVFVAAGPLEAQAPAPATFSADTTSIAGDDPFEVDVTFDPGDEVVGALTGAVVYDSSLLSAVACTPGLGGGSCNANDAGVVRFALFDTSGFESGNLVTIEFVAIGVAESTAIDLSLRAVYDLDGEALTQPPVVQGGAVIWRDVVGGLTGEVTSLDTGEGLYGLQVCATSLDDAPAEVDVLEECVSTDGRGNFMFGDLFAGDYVVTVSDEAGLYAPARQEAMVTALDTAVLIFELEPAPTPGTPPTDDEEVVVPSPGTPPTDDEEVVVPSPGTPPTDDEEVVVPSPGTPPTDDEEVVVPSPGTPPTDDVVRPPTPEVVVTPLGSISGTVTNSATGGPVFGVTVCATVPVVGSSECKITNMAGEYVISDLRTSNYLVSASDSVLRFTSDKDLFVGVFEGTALSGIDFTVTPRG